MVVVSNIIIYYPISGEQCILVLCWSLIVHVQRVIFNW